MAFVPDHKYDIFISYAHVDDEPLLGVSTGWVTTLVDCMKRRLAQKLGRSDAFSIWMDHQLARSVDLTEQIIDVLGETAVLLVVLSPGYTASPWCLRERNAFLKLVQRRGKARVFVIERDKIGMGDRPPEFDGLLGFRFWTQDREGRAPRVLGEPSPTQEYFDLVNDLSHELAQTLRSMRESTRSAALPTPAARSEPSAGAGEETVFLAEVTDDLEHERNNVKRYLTQSGIAVLPDSWLSLEPGAFRAAVERDLTKCKVFAQLLSSAPGKKPPDLPQGYTQLQIDLARQAGLPILQWRSPNLDTSTVDDADHRAILESDTVRAEGGEEFKSEIRKRALEKPPRPPKKRVNAFVFVDMETGDRSLATQVCDVLDQFGADYVLPVQSDTPSENRRDLEANLLSCDGVIVVYGETTVTWVREQLRQCRKILAQRETPLQAFAVFEGPPEQKEPLDLKIHNMRILDCRGGLNQDELRSFLGNLQSGGA